MAAFPERDKPQKNHTTEKKKKEKNLWGKSR